MSVVEVFARSCAKRREQLVELVKKQYGNKGKIVLFADFENEQATFLQESNFYYLTGISEPGTALVIDLDGKSKIFIPDTNGTRKNWVAGALSLQDAQILGVDEVKYLGSPITGYEPSLFLRLENYRNLIDLLGKAKSEIFTVQQGKLQQTFVWDQLCGFNEGLEDRIIDVSGLIAQLRRKKENIEIDSLMQAIEITATAQESAARSIVDGAMECDVQAAIEYVFTSAGAKVAFPSIVGSGKNSTVLHYYQNNAQMQTGDMVVVDIGARYQNYSADITRTYPVGGKFSKRQREIYELVLQTQEYIADIAKPGMWMANKEEPKKSLLHLAREFMKKNGGYDKYFIHGLGHYLGLDTHDVGSYITPLQEGDVITIEPGIYIPDENLGVRIEDNYLVAKSGVVCLSEQIPKQVDEIEKLVANKW